MESIFHIIRLIMFFIVSAHSHLYLKAINYNDEYRHNFTGYLGHHAITIIAFFFHTVFQVQIEMLVGQHSQFMHYSKTFYH